MNKLSFSIFLFYFFLISCDRKETNISIYNYSLINNMVHNLKLNINESNGSLDFEYLKQKDSTKRLHFKYNFEKDILISKIDTFLRINKSFKTKEFDFKMYQSKIIRSHNRILVFNENYGLIANIAFGGSSIFTKDSITNKQKELLFKELFLQLNKINIE